MICPWCGKPLTRGKLYGDRYTLKWLNDGIRLTLGFALDGISVGRPRYMMGRPYAVGYRCADCRRIVVDEDESNRAG